MGWTNPATAVTGDIITAAFWNTSGRDNLLFFYGIRQRAGTLVVAASNSSQDGKDAADYLCDGVDDQTEINNALTALGATGGTVILLEGTYTLSGEISIPSKAHLKGQGRGTVIKLKNSYTTDPAATVRALKNSDFGGGNTQITLSDLTIDGNKANQTAGTHYCAYFENVSFLTVENVLFDASRNEGLTLKSCTSSLVEACDLTNHGSSGFHADTCTGVRVAQCLSKSNVTVGFSVDNTSKYIVFTECEAQAGTSASAIGFFLGSATLNCSILGCISRSHTSAVGYQIAGKYAIVNGCTAAECGESGFVVTGDFNTLEHCVATLNNQHGITISSGDHNVVQGCLCRDNSQSANVTYDNLLVSNSSVYNLLQGNTCRHDSGLTNKPRYGLRVDVGSNNNIAAHNDLYTGGATAGLSDAGTATVTWGGNRT